MLNAAGKVIQIGIEIRGIILKNLENFCICAFPPALELKIFNIEKTPPNIGNMPYGSGALKSLNQNIPSVKMAGQIS
jgi:hypothetical protein